MTKLLLALLFVSIARISKAQNVIITDTIASPDSVIIDDIKGNLLDNIPVISLDDNELNDGSSQTVSSLLTAGRDPFFNAASFNFSALRFRMRGYNGDHSATFINGIPMNDVSNGFAASGLWSGLNDVFHNRDITIGVRFNTFSFGDIGSTTNIDVRASKQKPQTSFGYAYSNRSYDHRVTFTHSTGLNKKGWAFTVSGSRRYANEGYAPGTYFDGWSWFGAVDKKIGQRQIVSFISFFAPTESARQGSSTQEMIDLAGTHYYNPYWGYQNGKKRNANISKTHQPVIILTHDFRINNKTDVTTSLSYSFGEKSSASFDWFNAPDPRPDYYRYLPSYYANDPQQQQQVADNLKNNEASRQIDWENLYNINRENITTVYNANGVTGNTVTGNRSYYIQGERVTNSKKICFSTVLNARLNNIVDLTAGLSYQSLVNNYFQRIADLLGGSFWVDLNQFAQREFPNDANAYQNDLNQPNQIVKTGDKYGYNYDININRAAIWSQFLFRFSRVDFFIAGEGSQTIFSRTGNVKNGLFPDNSYGKSPSNVFYNYGIKGGFTYKINGRNYLYASGALITRPPYYDDAYISPRTRDALQDSLTNEQILTAEGGYILNAPRLKIHLVGYYTQTKHGFNVLTFYHDEFQDFVNYALSNIDRLYFGTEFGFDANVARNLSLSGAASIGRYYYNSRQKGIVSADNSSTILQVETVYSKNYRIASSPQEAYSFTVSYKSPKYWFVNLTGNYFDQLWLDFNPLRRTSLATDDLSPESEKWNSVLDQQRLHPQYTVDAFAGYSWKIRHAYIGSGFGRKAVYLSFYAGVNNLLNNQNIISGGYEQLRFDYSTSDIGKFPPKYFYAYGLNYFASAALRF